MVHHAGPPSSAPRPGRTRSHRPPQAEPDRGAQSQRPSRATRYLDPRSLVLAIAMVIAAVVLFATRSVTDAAVLTTLGVLLTVAYLTHRRTQARRQAFSDRNAGRRRPESASPSTAETSNDRRPLDRS